MNVQWLEEGAIFTVDGLLSPEECADLVALAEGVGFDEAPVTTGLGPLRLPSVRNNTRVMLDDAARAEALWRRVEDLAPVVMYHEPTGLNERLRFYRYTPGQFFARHRDGWYARDRQERSLYTVMVYLNEDFEGGETAFNEHVVEPRTGRLLVFLHARMHEGRPVRSGVKYALRTDLMYRQVG